MGKKKSKTPDAPDYYGLATQEAELNKEAWERATKAGRPDQIGIGGQSTWEMDDETGDWTQRLGLSDANQGIYDDLMGSAGEAAGNFQGADFSGVGDLPEVGGYNQQAIDTIRALQAPDLQQRRGAKEAQMAAMGMSTGSGKAWENEQRSLNDAESRADLNAILAGIEQGNKQFGQGMDLYSTGIAGETAMAQQKQNELSGLLGLTRNMEQVNLPAFTSYGPPGAADLTGAGQNAYQADLDKTNAANADKSNMWNTVGTVGTIGATIF